MVPGSLTLAPLEVGVYHVLVGAVRLQVHVAVQGVVLEGEHQVRHRSHVVDVDHQHRDPMLVPRGVPSGGQHLHIGDFVVLRRVPYV